MRDLRLRAAKGCTAPDSRLSFDLLCIDGFMSMDVEERGAMTCTCPRSLSSVNAILQAGQLRQAQECNTVHQEPSPRVISMSGPDHHLYDPSEEDPVGT